MSDKGHMNEIEYWVDGTYIVVALIVVTVVVLVVLTVLADVLKFVVCNVDTVVDELKSSRW
jgi:hypothetical protein